MNIDNTEEWVRFTVMNLSHKDKCLEIQMICPICIQFYPHNAVVFNSSMKWLFGTNKASNEESFGEKLRGNFLETDVINPE